MSDRLNHDLELPDLPTAPPAPEAGFVALYGRGGVLRVQTPHGEQALHASPAGLVAAEVLPALAVVYPSADGLRLVNPLAGHSAHTALGLVEAETPPGQAPALRTAGLMGHAGWSWTPGLPIYCGAAGALTQTVPLSGAVLPVALALTPTLIDVRIGRAIFIVESDQ